jgi:hypothetical protein
MTTPKECLRCRGPMEPGFVLDKGHHNSRDVQKWIEGEPERSFWQGIKTKGREQHLVRTYRCERCGYLESYAGD